LKIVQNFKVTVTGNEASLSYSQMFKILTQFTGEIPLGIYRTDPEIKEMPGKTPPSLPRTRSKSIIESLSFKRKQQK
jgi:hypothetical protein